MRGDWLESRDADRYFEDLAERRAGYYGDDYDPEDGRVDDWPEDEDEPTQLLLPLVWDEGWDDIPF